MIARNLRFTYIAFFSIPENADIFCSTEYTLIFILRNTWRPKKKIYPFWKVFTFIKFTKFLGIARNPVNQHEKGVVIKDILLTTFFQS